MILAALSLIALLTLALVASIALVLRHVAFEQHARRHARRADDPALPLAA
jgi:hypothetical protein